MDKISVIVPCYNEEEVLPLFYKEITRVAGEMKGQYIEVIFVNDGSRDGTLKLLKEFASNEIHLIFEKLWKRIGYVCRT